MSSSKAKFSSLPTEILLVKAEVGPKDLSVRYRPLGETCGVGLPVIDHDGVFADSTLAVAAWVALRATDRSANLEFDRLFFNLNKFNLKVLDYACRLFVHNPKLDLPASFVPLMRNLTIIVPPWTNLWGDAWYNSWGDTSPSRERLALSITTSKAAGNPYIIGAKAISKDQDTTVLAVSIDSGKNSMVWDFKGLIGIAISMRGLGVKRDST